MLNGVKIENVRKYWDWTFAQAAQAATVNHYQYTDAKYEYEYEIMAKVLICSAFVVGAKRNRRAANEQH